MLGERLEALAASEETRRRFFFDFFLRKRIPEIIFSGGVSDEIGESITIV